MHAAKLQGRVAAVLLCVAMTACHSWKPESVSAGQTTTWRHPVRVTLVSGQEVVLLHATVQGDTLSGVLSPGRADSVVRFPVRSIRVVEQRRVSVSRTVAVVAYSAAGVALLIFVAVRAAFDGFMDG